MIYDRILRCNLIHVADPALWEKAWLLVLWSSLRCNTALSFYSGLGPVMHSKVNIGRINLLQLSPHFFLVMWYY